MSRNIARFPEAFRFQLTKEESKNLRSQFVTSSGVHGGRRYLPYVFTEQGVAMLSAVLRSEARGQSKGSELIMDYRLRLLWYSDPSTLLVRHSLR